MFHSSFAHLQFSPQLLYWHSNLFPPAILCVAAPKKQTVAFPAGKFDIVKPGVVRVNDAPQIQPMFRGLELECKRYALRPIRFSWPEILVSLLGVVFLAALLFLDQTRIGEIILWRV